MMHLSLVVPPLLRAALTASKAPSPVLEDIASTTEDPIPTVVDIDTDGYFLSHRTRFTAVQVETTDDN